MPASTNTLCSAATSLCVCCHALAIALKRAHGNKPLLLVSGSSYWPLLLVFGRSSY